MYAVLPVSYSGMLLNFLCLSLPFGLERWFLLFSKSMLVSVSGSCPNWSKYMSVYIHLLKGKILSNLKPSECLILSTVDIQKRQVSAERELFASRGLLQIFQLSSLDKNLISISCHFVYHSLYLTQNLKTQFSCAVVYQIIPDNQSIRSRKCKLQCSVCWVRALPAGDREFSAIQFLGTSTEMVIHKGFVYFCLSVLNHRPWKYKYKFNFQAFKVKWRLPFLLCHK